MQRICINFGYYPYALAITKPCLLCYCLNHAVSATRHLPDRGKQNPGICQLAWVPTPDFDKSRLGAPSSHASKGASAASPGKSGNGPNYHESWFRPVFYSSGYLFTPDFEFGMTQAFLGQMDGTSRTGMGLKPPKPGSFGIWGPPTTRAVATCIPGISSRC